jgi:excisionase family DNA binding protein
MTTFLTTQDVQALLHVDKSTVYRMADDGRLPGVKVGRQWRFPADQIADQLGVATMPAPSPAPNDPLPHLTELLDDDTIRTIIELLADLYGVMAVVTDMDGNPLTPVVNPCGFYTTIAAQPAASELCITEWRSFAQRPKMAPPRFTPSHLGFHCARTFAWAGTEPVGMLLIGGVTPPDWPPSAAFMSGIADAIGVSDAHIEAVVDQTFDVPHDRQRWMLHTLPQVGDLVTQLLTAQRRLVSKLDAIADLLQQPQNRTGS